MFPIRLRFISIIMLILIVACSPDPNIAISTAVAGTMEAQIIQTGVAATQEAAFTPTPLPELLCIDLADDYLDETDEFIERWFDAVEIAGSTSRISLSGPVSELQAIRRDFTRLEPPACAITISRAIESMMDHTIEGFLLFMADEPESQIDNEFDQATNAAENYREAVDALIAQAARATAEASVTLTPDE